MSAAAIDLGLDLPPLPDIPAQLHRTSLRLLQAAMRAQLPGNLKLLLHTLCMHHNDQAGCAWPSVERLAKLCSTSTRTVQRNLSQLVQQGMVVVGRAPGIRSNAYAVQEERLHTIAIPNPKRTAPAQPHWLRPTTTFAAPPPTPEPPKATPSAPTPDTHVTQTEVNGVELKKTGEEAQNPAAAAQAEQATLAQVNAQRQRNGKRALSRADTQNMARQAQRARITPLQALQWVLARPSRNFFKADYAGGAGGTDCAGAGAGGASDATPAAPPAYRPTPPAAPDLDTQALIARQARAQEAKAAKPPAIVPDPRPLTVAGQPITGPAWAMSAVRQFCAGAPVSLFRIQAACSVLGVSHKTLRSAGAAAAAAGRLMV